MAEAITLKVDVNVFKQTLEELGSLLGNLENQKNALETTIRTKMVEANFGGSDVQSAIALANKEKDYVQNSINKVKAERQAIMNQLNLRETSASTLNSDVTSIDQSLPDIFANSVDI